MRGGRGRGWGGEGGKGGERGWWGVGGGGGGRGGEIMGNRQVDRKKWVSMVERMMGEFGVVG